jgi:hypothetical protein
MRRKIQVGRPRKTSKFITTHSVGFFDLQQELRNMIYGLLLQFKLALIRKGARKCVRTHTTRSWGVYWADYQRAQSLSLLQTCRRVNWEASPIFYARNEFQVSDLYAFLDHLPGLPILSPNLTSYPGPGRLNIHHLETLSLTHWCTNLDCGDAGDFLIMVVRLSSRCPSLRSLKVHFEDLQTDFNHGSQHTYKHFSNWLIEFEGRARGCSGRRSRSTLSLRMYATFSARK